MRKFKGYLLLSACLMPYIYIHRYIRIYFNRGRVTGEIVGDIRTMHGIVFQDIPYSCIFQI